MRLEPHERAPGRWDYDGSCAPEPRGGKWRMPRGMPRSQKTFSLGCFKWRERPDGNLGRSKVIKRFKGDLHDPAEAFREADAYCVRMEREARIPQP